MPPPLLTTPRVTVIGAGIGGLVAALELAVQGFDVTLVERAATPGGKIRQTFVAGAELDAGPTVFTMRWVFEAILAEAGLSLSDAWELEPLETLARHAWSETERLDLFGDMERSAQAIGEFAGKGEAEGYLSFCRRARAVHDALKSSFIAASRPNLLSLTARMGAHGLFDMMRASPFQTLWGALGEHFKDARLRQLFARYATYCGSSPFAAPATLMLIADVERQGVWRVKGGIHRVAARIAEFAKAKGAVFKFETTAKRIHRSQGRASAVETEAGETFLADAVIMNGDVSALGKGMMGEDSPKQPSGERRSLSAFTMAMSASCEGFPLLHHNVFFGDDYRGEFDEIFSRRRLPSRPSVYVCAQDRADSADLTGRREKLFLIVNAPAVDEHDDITPEDLRSCEQATFQRLTRCGLTITRDETTTERTTPMDFARMFPGTGGALYGLATHGWRASFTRPGSRGALPGLYLAGGSVHPGPGMPMAALSGLQAARSVTLDLTSRRRSFRAAMLGGMSTL